MIGELAILKTLIVRLFCGSVGVSSAVRNQRYMHQPTLESPEIESFSSSRTETG